MTFVTLPYFRIFATTPAPTDLPPSRIAKRVRTDVDENVVYVTIPLTPTSVELLIEDLADALILLNAARQSRIREDYATTMARIQKRIDREDCGGCPDPGDCRCA